MKSITIKGVIMGFGLALLTLTMAGAKMKFFTLAEKTRGSEFIVIGDVEELGSDHIMLAIKEQIKGSLPEKRIRVSWDREENIEKPVAHHQVGDHLLLFANKAGSSYEPFAGAQGTLKLENGWANQYEEAIKKIMEYDSARGLPERIKVLSSMIKSNNRLMQDGALMEIDHLNVGARKDKAVRNLIPDIFLLAKGPDRDVAIRATETLTILGGRETMPLLTELVGSEHGSVSEVASRALSQKTGHERAVNWKEPLAERKKAMREWQDWWEKNKGKAKLRE